MSATTSPARRRRFWTVFILVVAGGLYLESAYHEMFFSKLLIFGSFGVWSWTLPRPLRLLHLGMVALLCGALLFNKYHYRNQHLVPLGNGAYLVKND